MLFNPAFSPRLLAAPLALALLAAPAGADVLNSGLEIEPGQFFELGGGQKGGFTVTGRNTGPSAVVVYVMADGPDANLVERGTVAPGASVDATFGPGDMAVLRNTSTMETARLKLKIAGDISTLGMTYSPDPAAKRRLNPR
ncbi:hypothetical protein [Erythrobacter sp. WG]|uniref:hypothetical protein n=1 Tax=Erythrobacter sp. WG TaxID=2985510 RepID=UPI00226E6282|nr:hypothetical protein [Erythrobacter sp. WG]MCX9146826.1 hypothetical protein [Erythrobacter sp. WG]